MTTNWQRPILSALPEKGYKDNPTVDYLTSWVDTRLANTASQMQNLYADLCDPLTAQPRYLDYLGYLCGLSGSYWDVTWSTEVKRKLILNSHQLLWSLKGTRQALSFVLDTHNLQHQLWEDGQMVMPFKMSAAFGTSKMRFYLQLPLKYRREGKEWAEAKRTVRNFAPAVVKHQVVYERFFMGFSQLGEVLF